MARFLLSLLIISSSFFSLTTARHLPQDTKMANSPSSSMHLNIAQPPFMISSENEAHKRRKDSDKSMAGGEVIIAGLATAILAVVFCYIRVTRQKDDPQGKF
ncbi:hypothetical protein LUZ60_001416 [Juncus effusus]|nr:hypothetical protein LUZ60_001416 [Juncus effusus]